MFLSNDCNFRYCKKNFVPKLDTLFWFCNKDLTIKVLFSFSSFNNFICSRKEKTKSDLCFSVLLDSIWFFKSQIWSIKRGFQSIHMYFLRWDTLRVNIAIFCLCWNFTHLWRLLCDRNRFYFRFCECFF